jgi:predicted transposase YdaD
LEEGELKGELRDVFKTRLETARNMKSLGLSIEIIQKSVGLTKDELKENGIL